MSRFERASLSAILFATTCCAASAQEPGRVGMDTVAIRQLAAIYLRQPGDSLACVAGHFSGALPVLDSVSVVAKVCPERTFAMVGFMYTEPDQEQLVGQFVTVLQIRRDVSLVGEVHALVPVTLAGGREVQAPLLLAVWRLPRIRPPSRPGDGP